MAARVALDGGRRRWRLRVAAWSAVPAILGAPLVAMPFTDEVNWTAADFAFAGVLLAGVGLAYELAVRMTRNTAYRAGAGIALAGAMLLAWVNAAVGIIGAEGNAANLMYAGVLAVGLLGSAVARLRAPGMARTMTGMAAAQVMVGVVALVGRMGAEVPGWQWDILGVTSLCVALWLTSAWCFRAAARTR